MNQNQKVISVAVATALFSLSPLSAEEIFEPRGLDQIKEIIQADSRIEKKVEQGNLPITLESIDGMNNLIREAIVKNALVNDGTISPADVRDINRYLATNYENLWYQLRGESAREESTGYSIVDNKSVRTDTKVFNTSASRVWGHIYNLGFPTEDKNRLVDATGKKSASFTTVAYYLDEIMKDEIDSKALYNSEYDSIVGNTGTNLDSLVDIIVRDKGLLKKVSTEDIREGAKAADNMNKLIIKAIVENGLANDKQLSTADIRTVNRYLVEEYQEDWALYHGDDGGTEETGYHRVQNDGAYSRIFADNVVNSVADGIYHLGFYTDKKDRLLNEDGDANKRFEKVAWWLDSILKDDLEAGELSNNEYVEVVGTTGTVLDQIIPYIYTNEGLLLNVSMDDIRAASEAANEMNKLIVEAIKVTGVAGDEYISKDEVKELNKYLVANYESRWIELHGDDENGEETGYHRVQNDGAKGDFYNRNVINNLVDSLYHLGFYTDNENRLLNEDGNKNASFSNVAYWMNKSFKEDYAKGTLK